MQETKNNLSIDLPNQHNWQKAGKFGFWTAISTSLLTIISFALAMTAIPKSGPSCPKDCVDYPYRDIADFFPGDYYWMYTALVLMIVYSVLFAIIHHYAPEDKKLFSHISQNFALVAMIIITIDYFIQIRVIQPSVIRGETEGIALLTQYNAHGVFIAMEDIGYLMMSFAFLFLAFVFTAPSKLEKWIRRLSLINFVAAIISLIILSIYWGNDLEYRFEVIIISLNWLTLIVVGFLLARLFLKEYMVARGTT